jgi:ATP-dependent RNA helicase SUPV3L1/SUV3
MDAPRRVTAVLGPTNTGKTHYAIDRMLAHRTGVIGLPLRLLAREVYDRIVAARRPVGRGAGDGRRAHRPDRCAILGLHHRSDAAGDRRGFRGGRRDPALRRCRPRPCLHRPASARGACTKRCFWGPTPCAGRLRAGAAGHLPETRAFFDLRYSGSKKISRMPERSAIVGFSVENVYAIAELIRRPRAVARWSWGRFPPAPATRRWLCTRTAMSIIWWRPMPSAWA